MCVCVSGGASPKRNVKRLHDSSHFLSVLIQSFDRDFWDDSFISHSEKHSAPCAEVRLAPPDSGCSPCCREEFWSGSGLTRPAGLTLTLPQAPVSEHGRSFTSADQRCKPLLHRLQDV